MIRKNVPKTPELHTEHAAMTMLELYVPAQSSEGELLDGIVYSTQDADGVETRTYARPLISFYEDGHVEGVDSAGGFAGHGHRDAWAATSLDDGMTWNRKNLSKSGDLSSFTIGSGQHKEPYPGDVVRLFAGSDGNKALLVWASRYCRSGSPTYALTQEEIALLVAAEDAGGDPFFDEDSIGTGTCEAIPEDTTDYVFDTEICPYFEDYWGVAGSQGSSDFADEGYPDVGEVPFSCMWAARGTLEPVDADGNFALDGGYFKMIWRKAERLTSGRRDAYRMEAHCVEGAGCVVTWQEDPEGMRPGEGEGPGEGWSGAIAHHQTDTWYSYISWNNFDYIDNPATQELGDPVLLSDLDTLEGSPKVGIPMSLPVRLTDNAMCVGEDADGADDPYCYADFDGNTISDFCAETYLVTAETPAGNTETIDAMCVTEDGRLLRGNTAATRPRTNLRGYDTDGDGILDRAWVLVAYEENKGLGEEDDLSGAVLGIDGTPLQPDDTEEMTKVDMGKNIWYHTFDMLNPELVSQGMMLNQPAVYPDDFTALGSLALDTSLGYNFMTIEPDPIYDTQAGIDTTTLYQSEISRRFSLISQEGDEFGESRTVALTMWKQGIVRRGGPADVMARRFVVPEDWNPATDNPFAYENMVCAEADGTQVEMAFGDGSNPRYVKGFCPAPAIALSTTTIVACNDSTGNLSDPATCIDEFPWSAYFDDIDRSDSETTGLAKITEWRWCEEGTAFNITNEGDGATAYTCDDSDIDDNTWDNPYDVAKGHRGFMEGDFIMMLYAWSPNWMANTVGHDNYNLYVRRSFDGGQTWTTTPASGTYIDGAPEGTEYAGTGTTTCEWMGPAGTDNEFPVCVEYGAGEFEQARNVSQLVGSQETILDPRYSPTRSPITEASLEALPYDNVFVMPPDEWVELDATRDPSRFFMVYETGDNTTVEAGEAEPLDLFYSRGVVWGDHFLVWTEADTETADLTLCLPSNAAVEVGDYVLDGFCNEFDWLEGSHKLMSGEASVTANPRGDFFYALWNQEDLDGEHEVVGADAWFRRVWYLDDYVPADAYEENLDNVGGGTGPSGQGNVKPVMFKPAVVVP